MDTQEPVFDNVKFEKAKAMARCNHFRKITKLLQFLEVFVALMLISWLSTRLPESMKISNSFLFEVVNYLFNPHVVFVIGNTIIVAVFVLCRGNGSDSENSGDSDLYDDYVCHSKAHAQQQNVLPSERDKNPAPEPPATPEIEDMMANSGGGGDEAEEQQIVLFSKTEEKAEQCDEVTTAIKKVTKQIEMFQRTRTEKLKREIAATPRGELQLSETVKVRRGRTGRPKMTSFDTVDKLSNEEFNLTIDAFIKRQQEFFMEQKLAEKEELKKDVRVNYRCVSMR